MAIKEQDFWVYEGLHPRGEWSFVCSSYVIALYKASGLLADYDIQATEFTPRDLYTLNVFDRNWTKTEACMKAEPDFPYGCQISGKYHYTYPGYSTIDPYHHMCERCPTIAPTYERPDHC